MSASDGPPAAAFPSGNRTARFLGGAPAVGAALSVASVHGLWGGFIITVCGGGGTTVRLIERGAHYERRFALHLPPSEVYALFRLAVAGDLLGAVRPPRTRLIPDESACTVTLHNGDREWSIEVWEHDPPPPAVAAVIAALRALEARTAGLAPAYEGPFHSGAQNP